MSCHVPYSPTLRKICPLWSARPLRSARNTATRYKQMKIWFRLAREPVRPSYFTTRVSIWILRMVTCSNSGICWRVDDECFEWSKRPRVNAYIYIYILRQTSCPNVFIQKRKSNRTRRTIFKQLYRIFAQNTYSVLRVFVKILFWYKTNHISLPPFTSV